MYELDVMWKTEAMHTFHFMQRATQIIETRFFSVRPMSERIKDGTLRKWLNGQI